jgi:hypothetical protein
MSEIPGRPPTGASKPPPEKIVEKVVTGEVASRKKPLGRRIRDIFIGGDNKTVVQYVVQEVLIPQAKDMANELVSTYIEKMLYGESRPRSRPSGYRPSVSPGPTNYTRYGERGNNPVGRHTMGRQPNASVAAKPIDDMLFATRIEGETVLNNMYKLLEGYEFVSLRDLYSLVGWSTSYMDEKWGWTSLNGSDVRRVRDGYTLILPDPTPLD